MIPGTLRRIDAFCRSVFAHSHNTTAGRCRVGSQGAVVSSSPGDQVPERLRRRRPEFRRLIRSRGDTAPRDDELGFCRQRRGENPGIIRIHAGTPGTVAEPVSARWSTLTAASILSRSTPDIRLRTHSNWSTTNALVDPQRFTGARVLDPPQRCTGAGRGL